MGVFTEQHLAKATYQGLSLLLQSVVYQHSLLPSVPGDPDTVRTHEVLTLTEEHSKSISLKEAWSCVHFSDEETELEEVSNLLKVIQPVSGEAGLQTQVSGSCSARSGLLGKEDRLHRRKEEGEGLGLGHPGLPGEGV